MKLFLALSAVGTIGGIVIGSIGCACAMVASKKLRDFTEKVSKVFEK